MITYDDCNAHYRRRKKRNQHTFTMRGYFGFQYCHCEYKPEGDYFTLGTFIDVYRDRYHVRNMQYQIGYNTPWRQNRLFTVCGLYLSRCKDKMLQALMCRGHYITGDFTYWPKTDKFKIQGTLKRWTRDKAREVKLKKLLPEISAVRKILDLPQKQSQYPRWDYNVRMMNESIGKWRNLKLTPDKMDDIREMKLEPTYPGSVYEKKLTGLLKLKRVSSSRSATS